ncbi:MAG TPA: hypothetical protein VHN80_00020 [Kineosporiaceae bacterium]|nr:hypothetical protein [Kineosporiaceae bacterium]
MSGAYFADSRLVDALAAQALDLDHRYGFGWLGAIAGCVHSWAEAHLTGRISDAVSTIEAHLAYVRDGARMGNESILRLLLADVYALDGRIDAARSALLRARQNPGPYRGLFVAMLDERLRPSGPA